MNLSAYDTISNKLNKRKTWLDNNKQVIISREVNKRPYYTFVKRYEPELNTNVFFLVLLDDKTPNSQCYITHQDDYGRLKFNVSPIWKELPFTEYIGQNIPLEYIEHTDDGDIYKIDI